MATQAIMKITTGFADESSRVHEFGPFATTAAAITNAKTNIASFNENISDLAGLYISDGGANCTGITDAEIHVTTETVYNLNSQEVDD